MFIVNIFDLICFAAAITNSSWTLMIKEILEYIPSAPYTYIGGLTLLSELLPLPLPMTSSEVSQAYV